MRSQHQGIIQCCAESTPRVNTVAGFDYLEKYSQSSLGPGFPGRYSLKREKEAPQLPNVQ